MYEEQSGHKNINQKDLVHILLHKAEQNYSYYAQHSAQKDTVGLRRVKKKLRTALKWARRARNLKPALHRKTLLELRVYESTLLAALHRLRQDFEKAKQEYVFQTQMLRELVHASDRLSAAVLRSLLESSEQALKYCKFHLNEFGGDEAEAIVLDVEEVRRMLEEDADKGSRLTEVRIYGESIGISDPEAGRAQKRLLMLRSSYQSNLDNTNVGVREDLFWEMVNACEAGVRLSGRRAREEGSGEAKEQ